MKFKKLIYTNLISILLYHQILEFYFIILKLWDGNRRKNHLIQDWNRRAENEAFAWKAVIPYQRVWFLIWLFHF